jgi:LPXTG-motif cell wall-anchored protein
LTNVTVTDAEVPACDRDKDHAETGELESMAPGATVNYSCEVTGVNAPIRNIVVADAVTVTDSDPSTLIVVSPSAVIGDTVWYDTNDNGVQDTGELGIEDTKVTLVGLDGQDVDPDTAGVQTTLSQLTNVDGKYLFSGLFAGNYKVQVLIGDVPDAQDRTLRFTTASSFTILLPDGGERLDADFGVIADTLPETGINTDQIALASLLLLAAGALALLVARRREEQYGTDMAA